MSDEDCQLSGLFVEPYQCVANQPESDNFNLPEADFWPGPRLQLHAELATLVANTGILFRLFAFVIT